MPTQRLHCLIAQSSPHKPCRPATYLVTRLATPQPIHRARELVAPWGQRLRARPRHSDFIDGVPVGTVGRADPHRLGTWRAS